MSKRSRIENLALTECQLPCGILRETAIVDILTRDSKGLFKLKLTLKRETAWHLSCSYHRLSMAEDENGSESPPAENPAEKSETSFRERTKTIVRRIRGFNLRKKPEGAPVEPEAPAQPVPAAPIVGSQTGSHRIEGSLTGIRRVKLLGFAEWASQTVQNRGIAFYGNLITIVLCTYFLADIVAIFAGKFIPEPPAVRPVRTSAVHRAKSMDDYSMIFTRNLFNHQGLIPGEENTGPMDLGGAPIKTSLPFNLVGTLILSDELRSIATIEDKTASMVYPVRVDEEIPNKARIVKIEPRKVIFVNSQSGRREYVELPDDMPLNNARIALPTTSGGPGIEQAAPGQFNISRSAVDHALSDFNTILTQARAVPNFENGAPAGYKLFQIVPGSIYDQLGLHNGDVIMGFDGQAINDPQKAFELLAKLKEGASHMEMQVKRDGKPTTMTYDIH